MAETQPMMLQALCYTAADFRLQLASLVCGEGVAGVAEGSLEVTTGAADLDLTVAEGAGFIESDVADQGIYSVFNDAPVTVTAPDADAADPRIDQVIATVNDSQQVGVDDNWVLSVLEGTPTTGATLANLDGAATLPDRSIRLAYVLVPATFTGPFVDATHILDARETYAKCDDEPYVEIEADNVTSLANGTYTQVSLPTVVHIDRAYFSVSGSTVTILQDGLYDFTGWGGLSSAGTGGTQRTAAIHKNNTNLPNASPNGVLVGDHRNGALDTCFLTPHREKFRFAAGDTLKLSMNQNSGGAVNTVHAPSTIAPSSLMIRKVG